MDVLQERLRPRRWDELVGMEFKPDGKETEKELFMELAAGDDAMSVLLHGPPGTGKTTAILLFANTYLGDHMDTKFKRYNASSEINKGTINGEVVDFAGSVDDSGLRNVIFFDEVDGVGWQAQDTLRAVMEEYSYSCIFLMACNKIHRVHEAIRSRSAEFKMGKLPTEWSVDWFIKSSDRLGMEVSEVTARTVLDHYNGDLRKVISDFFTKFKKKRVENWQPSPTFADQIANSDSPIDTYATLARQKYIEPVNLLRELFILNGKKNAKVFSLAADRILIGGDVLINMCMALETL